MVVSENNQVEARHLHSNVQGGIFFIFRSGDAAEIARVEKSDNDVGMFVLLQVVNPVARTFHYLFEA